MRKHQRFDFWLHAYLIELRNIGLQGSPETAAQRADQALAVVENKYQEMVGDDDLPPIPKPPADEQK